MTAMLARLRESLAAASLLALAAASPALAQADRGSWVDPPARAETPSQPSGPSIQASAPPAEPALPSPSAQPKPESASQPKVQSAQPSEPSPSASPEPKAATRPNRATKPTLTFSPPETPPRAETPRAETPRVRSVRRPRQAPAAEPEVAARPQPPVRESRAPAEAAVAQQLAIDYLGYWSGPNAVAVGATPDFYAPRVLFHGRVVSVRALADEKRRFVQRWPQRHYTPRLETMRTTCDPSRDVCTVRALFDYAALNPGSGARARGAASLELGVSFATGRPRIVFESSHVLRRGRSARSAALHDAE